LIAFSDPIFRQILCDSALFGVAVSGPILLLTVAAGLDSRRRLRTKWWRLLRPIAELPPLVVGAGILALPWLLGVASRFLFDRDHHGAAVFIGDVAAAIDPHIRAWTLMAFCVGLVLVSRVFEHSGTGHAAFAGRHPRDSCYEAALLPGGARWRAWTLGAPWRLGLLLGRFVLVAAFAATNLTPALLFSTGTDRPTLGPAFLDLAGGEALAQSQASALALAGIFVNLAAIAVAKGTRALPFDSHLA
jgi:hypothetical protein